MNEPVDTHCPYCGLQCAMSLVREPANQALRVVPRDFPTNRGGLCRKGWSSTALLDHPDRLTAPLVRDREGRLVTTSWSEALDLISARVTAAQMSHGPGAVGVFGGGGLTNEKAYTLGKFARAVLGTPYVDYNGRFCMSSAAAAANASLGVDRGLPFPLQDLNGADVVMLVGSNPADTMPPSLTHLADVRSRGGLLVVDPRRSATARLCDDMSGIHLAPVPGTDLVILLALLHVVFAEGLADEQYLTARVRGVDELRASVRQWWPERAEVQCGVSAARLRQVARMLAAASPARGGRGAVILTGRGAEQGTQGTATVMAAINLALALGLPGRPHSGFGSITGQGNGQGGREHGQKCDQLPGYRSIEDPAARAHIAEVWGMDPGDLPGPGLPAVELLGCLGEPGRPQVLFIHGANPVVSAPNSAAVVDSLARLDLLVVCDFVLSETAAMADVVLPVPQWAEEDGTMTSLEGRVLRRRKALEPPAGVRSELQFWHDLAVRLGSPINLETDPATAFEELRRASSGGRADYGGITAQLIDDGVHWPAQAGTTGTPRLFADGFPTPDGRAQVHVVDHIGPAEPTDTQVPLHLITGRALEHYQSGAQTRRVPELRGAVPEVYVELHPFLAQRLGAADGDLLEVGSRRGWVRARARLTENVRPDTVFIPFHFSGESSVNRVTNDATDPTSKMPEFKFAAVSVRRVDADDLAQAVEVLA